MKRLRFKKWVEVSLIVINVLMILLMAAEVKDTLLFVVSHLGAAIVFVFNSYLLMKYTNLFED